MRTSRLSVILLLFCVRVHAYGAEPEVEPYAALARIVRDAHTTQLPDVDRVEVFALSFATSAGDPPKTDSGTFLVRPASPDRGLNSVTLPSSEIVVDVHASSELSGGMCDRIAGTWRTLAFEPNGTLCHVPTYGLRFYREQEMIFSVSVCWKCHNFYLPTIDPTTGQASFVLHGFADNSPAKKLLNDLRRLVPHPQIRHPRLR